MKAFPKGRVRPRILFSQTPHSVMRRAKSLSNRTAAELLRYLCEMTIGFGRGSVDLTYRALAEALHRDWSTIARAARLLRAMGDVEVERLESGSFRWYVLLESEDIVADPEGIYRLRAVESLARIGVPEGEILPPPWRQRHGGYGENAMGDIAPTPGGTPVGTKLSEPLFSTESAPWEPVQNDSLKIHVKDTSLKIHHQSASEGDDESLVTHKSLLEELIAIGTGQRMARKLLRNHEHGLIASALSRVRHRNDLENRAGYLIREVEDGGYEETPDLVQKPARVSREVVEPSSLPPMASVGVELTKVEFAALEDERERKAMASRQSAKVLLQRFAGLSDELKFELKSRWTRHLEQIVPNTPQKAAVLSDQTFHKMAFKTITANFFELVDQGLSPDGALAKLVA